MGYTPVELRHVKVARRLFGYHRASVEQILNDVAESFETVWRDRGELADKVELLEQQILELKGREQVLTNTLVAAEHAATELKDRAKHEAELIVTEAHSEARSILRSGQGERERLSAEVRRIEALLRSALGLVVEVGYPVATESPELQAAKTPESTPQDANEHRPVSAAQPEDPSGVEVEALTELEVGEPVQDELAPFELEEQPGWPPLREVAQRGADFEWGE